MQQFEHWFDRRTSVENLRKFRREHDLLSRDHFTGNKWWPEEVEWVADRMRDGWIDKKIVEEFEIEFGRSIAVDSIRQRRRQLGIASPPKPKVERKKYSQRKALWHREPRADRELLRIYGTRHSEDVAKYLSDIFHERVTTNAVIGRYHRLTERKNLSAGSAKGSDRLTSL